jgi:hypothetical protein
MFVFKQLSMFQQADIFFIDNVADNTSFSRFFVIYLITKQTLVNC